MTEDEVFAKGYDLGKQEAGRQQLSEIARLRAAEYKCNSYIVDNARLDKENKRLRDRVNLLETWLEGYAYCPCCTGVKECSEGCTFAEDDPAAHERMLDVRAVLYG